MKALYHREANEPQEFTVLKKNTDGTVDIGPENGAAIVTGCPVAKEAAPGFATLIEEAAKTVEEKTKK
jgi:hypothetical protein